MKPIKIFKREGNLTKQRTVACPTCHVPAGDFCKSVGMRGKAAGAIMKTSCHNARITAAGLPLRDFSKSRKPAKPAPVGSARAKANKKRSEAMKASWARRRQQTTPAPVKSSGSLSASNITLTRLMEMAFETLVGGNGAINSLTLSCEGVGTVTGKPLGDSVNLLITKG